MPWLFYITVRPKIAKKVEKIMITSYRQKLLPVQSTTSTTVGQQATGNNGPAAR